MWPELLRKENRSRKEYVCIQVYRAVELKWVLRMEVIENKRREGDMDGGRGRVSRVKGSSGREAVN